MIAVDWGTSNFRAFRLDANGAIRARRSSSCGILRVDRGGFPDALRREVGSWLVEGEKHILLCGMIGSRQGWVEAKYLPCPVEISDLANSVIPIPFPGAEVRLIPGVKGQDACGTPEVMRGEETQAVGILDTCGDAAVVCFPGTHSKWIHLSDGKIASFITCMTGELYEALSKCTILERTMKTASPTDNAAFLRGVARSADSGGLLHHLFGVRTLALMDQLSPEASPSYLSGLLLGHEIRAAMPRGSLVHLAGASALCSLYAQAIAACAGTSNLEDEDVAARGLAAIGRRLAWS